jgi:hypothetical protein
MKIVSMKQLRQRFDPIRKGLEKGETYLLMYRSKPLGVMRPYSPATDAQHLAAGEDPLALPVNPPLQGLPNPKTISFGSKIAPDTKLASAPSMPTMPTATPITAPYNKPAKPLDRLGMKKAFI